jgi:hypothetical protein
MITISNLFSRVAFHRPDLELALVGVCLRNTARKVARDTISMADTITFSSVLNKQEYVLTPTDPLTEVIRVNRAWIYNTNTTKWDPLMEWNYIELKKTFLMNNQTFQKPTSYADKFGTLVLYPVPNQPTVVPVGTAYQIRADCRIQPIGEFKTIDLPAESEDALVFGALSELFAYPGEKNNPPEAMAYLNRFEHASANLKQAANLGTSGDLYARPDAAFLARKRWRILPWPR